jgi:hypothetical protein
MKPPDIPHLAAWAGGLLAFGAAFFDIEWGHHMSSELAVGLLIAGLGAFGVSGAFAAGVRVPPQ